MSDGEEIPSLFAERSDLFSFALTVEDTKLWIPKEVLACHSPVFHRMLFGGGWAESESGAASLPGKALGDVVELLRVLVPSPALKPVDDANVDRLLAFAEEYELDALRAQCEDFLQRKLSGAKVGDAELLELLVLGSKHRLGGLLSAVIPACVNLSLQEVAVVKEQLRPNVVAVLYEGMLRKWVDGAGEGEGAETPPPKRSHQMGHCCTYSGFGGMGGGSRNAHVCSQCKAMFHCGHGVLCESCGRLFCHACQPRAKFCRPGARRSVVCRLCKTAAPCDCRLPVDQVLLGKWD